MISSLRLALLIAALPIAASGQEVLSGEGIAGVGAQGCETVTGVENAPMLAATVDWGLGYMAGRRDGGQRPVPDEPLSTTEPADLAVGILRYCRDNPYALVLDALRAYGLRVFAEGPAAEPGRQPRLPRVRPPSRPEDLTPNAARMAFVEPAGAAAELAAVGALDVADLIRLPAPVMLFSLPPVYTVSPASAEGSAAPAASPRPPRRPG